MHLNIFRYFYKLAIPALLCSATIGIAARPAFSTLAHSAVHVSWQGRPIPPTPLDTKIAAAGFYQIGRDGVLTGRRTLDQIFEQAMTFQYTRDGAADQWQAPSVTDRLKRGDCEDMAIWIYRELVRSGYANVRIMVGKFETSEKNYHTWVVCPAAGSDDFIVDPALQRRIWKRSDLSPDVYLPLFSFDGRKKYLHAAQ